MKKLLSGLILPALLMPVLVNAATAEELTAQIQLLLQQVTALQQQVGGTSASTPSTSGTSVTGGAVQCPLISRNLKKGMSGADVTRLQQFLALDPNIYPEAQITGYYGALTEAAVKRFQCKNTLVCDGTPESTGYGVTGPRTAALLALQCAARTQVSSSDVGGFIKVTPTAGSAPLQVTIEATVNTTNSCTGATYEVIYGDNTPSSTVVVPSNTCREMRQAFSHTYTSSGTYTIVLRSGVHQTSAAVTVGGGNAPVTTTPNQSVFTASPTSGNAPLTVTFSGVLSAAPQCASQTYTITFGDGQQANVVQNGCTSASYSIQHTYDSGGSFVARFLLGSSELKNIAITAAGNASGSQGGGAFSITAGTGGDAFAVTAQFDLSRSCGRYELNWGDGTANAVQAEGTCSSGTVTKEVSHIYQTGGMYTAILKRGASLSSTDTIGVSIVQ